jgi:hypothetical protein
VSLGCGTGRASPSEPAPRSGSGQTKEAQNQTRVQIDNQNTSDMNIYLISSGTRVFLGSVESFAKDTLAIPRGANSMSPGVRLLADPLGGSSPITTPNILVGPGKTVYWTIGSSASSSFASAD